MVRYEGYKYRDMGTALTLAALLVATAGDYVMVTGCRKLVCTLALVGAAFSGAQFQLEGSQDGENWVPITDATTVDVAGRVALEADCRGWAFIRPYFVTVDTGSVAVTPTIMLS